jgi:DNA-binding CsgD family transcriptional regulator
MVACTYKGRSAMAMDSDIDLTVKELRVLVDIARGTSVPLVIARLREGGEQKPAEKLREICRRLGVGTLFEAIVQAALRGLITTKDIPIKSPVFAKILYADLTEWEIRALNLFYQGFPIADIAREMGIGYNTVSTHLRTAKHKLFARSSKEAALVAYASGLLDQENAA